jgi:pyrroline-5-carboxylate reductase
MNENVIPEEHMRIGFVGTGVITSAIVTGLSTLPEINHPILVSPRNKQKAEHLSRSFDNVNVAASNQAILDHTDVVVLAILPQDKDNILSELTFKENHVVISLLAGTTNLEIAPLVSPAKRLIRAVPLPCVAKHIGPIATYPPDEIANRLFDPLGTFVAVQKEAQLETLSIITALMAPYYALLKTVVNWSEGQDVARKQAAEYTTAMFAALSVMSMEIQDGNLDVLVKESMTPGGLNEKAMDTIQDHGGFNPWRMALEDVKAKVKGG